MQAQTTAPIAINVPNAGPAPARGAEATQESGQFGEALSREIGQRQQARDAQATDAAPAGRGVADAGKAAAHAARSDAANVGAADAAKVAAPVAATAPAADIAAAADAEAIATAEEAAINPVTDMLALAASLAQASQAAAQRPAAAPAETPAPTAQAVDAAAADPAALAGALAASAAAAPAAAPVTAAPVADAATAGAAAPVAAPVPGAEAVALATAGIPLPPGLARTAAPAAPAPGSAVAPEASEGKAQGRGVFASAVVQAAQARQPAAQAAPQQDAEHPLEQLATAIAGGERVAETASREGQAPSNQFAAQLQAASRPEQAQASALLAGERLPARVGTPAWDKQLGQKIVFMAAGAEQSASLILNPPDLGPVQVVLNVTNDQASVTFSAQQLEVRQALESAMPKLREMMGESGITLGNATVNAGMPEQQQQAQRGQDARAGGNGMGGNGHGNGNGNGGEALVSGPARRASLGMVDTFA